MLGIDVELKAQGVSDRNAESIRYQEMENKFVIVLDPKLNISDEEALRTMRRFKPESDATTDPIFGTVSAHFFFLTRSLQSVY